MFINKTQEKSMKESELLKSATDYLSYLENMGKLVWFRNNSFQGRILRGDKSVGYIKNAKRGMPDLIVFTKYGYLCLEAKSRTGKQSENQKAFQKKIELLNGRYFIFKSFEELEREIRASI